MPLTRITLREGRGEQELQRLSALLQQTLVEEFDVPPGDRFQIIETLPAGRRYFDPHYLTGRRSENHILFQITAGKPRSRQQKQAFYRVLTERLYEQLAIAPDDVMVVIQFNNAEDWCFGNGAQFSLPSA